MIEIDYTKKPSVTQLRAAIKKAVSQGATSICLTWGENQITIEFNGSNDKWRGSGWIGRNGGFDLANELNIQAHFAKRLGNPMEFLRDKLTIIHVK